MKNDVECRLHLNTSICTAAPYSHRFLNIFCFGFYQHCQLSETIMFQHGWFIPGRVELITLPGPNHWGKVEETIGCSTKDKKSPNTSRSHLPTLSIIWRKRIFQWCLHTYSKQSSVSILLCEAGSGILGSSFLFLIMYLLGAFLRH